MPEDGDAWRQTLAFLDEDAQKQFGRGFAELADDEQAALVQAVQDDRRRLARLRRRARVEPVDPLRLHRLLLAPLGVERDRLPRAGLSAGLPEPGRGRPGEVGGSATRSRPTR